MIGYHGLGSNAPFLLSYCLERSISRSLSDRKSSLGHMLKCLSIGAMSDTIWLECGCLKYYCQYSMERVR